MDRGLAGGAIFFLLVMAGIAAIHFGAVSCQAQESVVSLSQLSAVSINGNSTAALDLLNPSFWFEVNAASGQTISKTLVLPMTNHENKPWLSSLNKLAFF